MKVRLFILTLLIFSTKNVFGQYPLYLGYSNTGIYNLHADVLNYSANANGKLTSLITDIQNDDTVSSCNFTYDDNFTAQYCFSHDSLPDSLRMRWDYNALRSIIPIYWNRRIYSISKFSGSNPYLLIMSDSFMVLDFKQFKYKGSIADFISWKGLGLGMLWNFSIGANSDKRYIYRFTDLQDKISEYEFKINNIKSLVKTDSTVFILDYDSGYYRLWRDSATNELARLPYAYGKFLSSYFTKKYGLYFFSNKDTLKYVKLEGETGQITKHFIRLSNSGVGIEEIKFIGDLGKFGVFVSGTYLGPGLDGRLSSFVLRMDTFCQPYKFGGFKCVLNSTSEVYLWMDKIIAAPDSFFYVGLNKVSGTYVSSPSHAGWRYSTGLYVIKTKLDNILQMGWNYPLDQTVNSKKEIAVYPNPTEEILYVDGIENGLCEVLDVSGRKILGQKLENARLDVSALKPGIYLLSIADPSGQTFTSRFIKN